MKLLVVSLTILAFLSFPGMVRADETRECTTSTGSYGQATTTCKILGETVVVKHEVTTTGLGDFSFYTVAAILILGSAAFFGFSKLSERTYWFD